ncbi:MAG: hypothetical protein ABII93_02805 [Chrysiogenia bacterium]
MESIAFLISSQDSKPLTTAALAAVLPIIGAALPYFLFAQLGEQERYAKKDKEKQGSDCQFYYQQFFTP